MRLLWLFACVLFTRTKSAEANTLTTTTTTTTTIVSEPCVITNGLHCENVPNITTAHTDAISTSVSPQHKQHSVTESVVDSSSDINFIIDKNSAINQEFDVKYNKLDADVGQVEKPISEHWFTTELSIQQHFESSEISVEQFSSRNELKEIQNKQLQTDEGENSAEDENVITNIEHSTITAINNESFADKTVDLLKNDDTRLHNASFIESTTYSINKNIANQSSILTYTDTLNYSSTYNNSDESSEVVEDSSSEFTIAIRNSDISSDSSEAASINGTWTNATCSKCINRNPKLTNFTSEYYNSTIRLSWTPLLESLDACIYTYDINCTSESSIIPYFRQEKRNSHILEYLRACEKYEVAVKANNFCSFGDLVETEVFTEPEFIKDLYIEIDYITNITWRDATSNYCAKYNVHVDGKNYTTEENYLTLPTALFCVKIGVQTIREDGVEGEITYQQVPAKVRNVHVKPNSDGFIIDWDRPEMADCVTGYIIIVNNEELYVTNNTITIHGLLSCVEYTIEIAARSESARGEFIGVIGETSIPETLSNVQNAHFSYDSEEVLMKASWEAPDHHKACITGYKVVINDKELVTNHTEYLISNLVGCMVYKLNIKAIIEDIAESKGVTITKEAPALTPAEPILLHTTVTKSSAMFSFQTESRETNMCQLNELSVDCRAFSEENLDFSRVLIEQKTAKINLNDSKAYPTINITVNGLTAFTNYTCRAFVVNIGDVSNYSDYIKVTTGAEAPPPPDNFTFIVTEANTIQFHWNEPSGVAGVIDLYELQVQPLNALHYIPNDCKIKVENNITEQILANVSKYKLIARPSYKYMASIRAHTVDLGEARTLEIYTNATKPENPRDISITIEEVTNEDIYNVSARISWLYPCETNGDIKKFTLELLGESLINEGSDKREILNIPINTNSNNIDYTYTVTNLKPFYNYTVLATTVGVSNSSESATVSFITPEGCPLAPINFFYETSSSWMFLKWDTPVQTNGILLNYSVTINSLGPSNKLPEDCPVDFTQYTGDTNETTFHFSEAKPNYNYEVYVLARTNNCSTSSEVLRVTTLPDRPDPVRNLTLKITDNQNASYDVVLEVAFDPPCDGSISMNYTVNLKGSNNELMDYAGVEGINLSYEFELKPEYDYVVVLMVRTEYGESFPSTISFTSPAGVPPPNSKNLSMSTLTPTTASIKFNQDLFSDNFGNILYYSVLLTTPDLYNERVEKFGHWNGIDWPVIGLWSGDGEQVEPYQATPNKWNPFNQFGLNQMTFVLGVENCTDADFICNGPLRPNTIYAMTVRGFTRNGFRNTDVIYFTTHDTSLAMSPVEITGIVMGVVACVLIIAGGGGFYFWRSRAFKPIQESDQEGEPIYAFPIKEFPPKYTALKDNAQVLKGEYSSLNGRSTEEALEVTTAVLPENKRKNRYTNVLPYDDTRVVLESDPEVYINASYIKGYSDKIEYIATQGPLEHTTEDFWNMVIEEGVTLIVMVAQFIEQNKTKCHKYFPDKHENTEIGDDLQIRCAAELDFEFYCERQITLQKDDRQYKVTHLQFLNWPDFGCPTGTENMLNFCSTMRRHIEQEYGKTVVHCSAGVGRTGTLIAVDILLQTLRDGCDLDVYNTVLNLRRQRKNMVQTEAQYLYIYNCLNDAIIDPPTLKEIKADKEPIYENIELKVIKSDNNNEDIELED